MGPSVHRAREAAETIHHVGTPFPEVCPMGTEPEDGFLGPPAAQPRTHPGALGKIFTAHSPRLQHAPGTGRPRKIWGVVGTVQRSAGLALTPCHRSGV